MPAFIRTLVTVSVLHLFCLPLTAQPPVEGEELKGSFIETGDLLVMIPESKKAVAVYSVTQAAWSSVRLSEPLESNKAVSVGMGFAVVQTPTSVYAFSETTGKWAELKLSKGSAAMPVLSANMIRVVDGDSIYIFGRNSKSWTGVSLITGEKIDKK